jgi:hypothetical protein
MKGKKAQDFLTGTIMFIIINVIFFAILFLAVSGISEGSMLTGQVYAKQIGLIIEDMKPGMVVKLDINRLLSVAEKNNYGSGNQQVILPFEDGKVSIKVSDKKEYSFSTFSSLKPKFTIDKRLGILTIET